MDLSSEEAEGTGGIVGGGSKEPPDFDQAGRKDLGEGGVDIGGGAEGGWWWGGGRELGEGGVSIHRRRISPYF